jgi:hypothetical protein
VRHLRKTDRTFTSSLVEPSVKSIKLWGVIAGSASIAVAAGLALPAGTYLTLVALLFLVAGALVALNLQHGTPVLGLAVLVVTAVAFPVEFRGPSSAMVSTSLPLAAALCGVWVLQAALTRSATSLDRSRVMYASLTFMAIALASFAVGLFPWFAGGGAPLAVQVAELGIFLTSVCLFLAVGHQLGSEAQLRWLTWLFLAAGFVVCTVQTVEGLRLVLGSWSTRPGSVGSLFWTWLVALSFAQAVFNRRLSVPIRLWLLSINVMVFYHGLVQVRSWASGWLPPLAALCAILLIRFPRTVTGVAAVALPLVLFFSGDISGWLLEFEENSVSTRLAAWETLWQLFERSPLLGTGLANYYYYTENLSILGWYVRFIAHNNYQDLLIQTGVLGLLGFFWLAYEMFRMAFRVYRWAPAGFVRAYALGAIGGLVGSLVAGWLGDWIIPFYYNAGIIGFRSSLFFWVFLGGVLALQRMALNKARAGARSSHQASLVQPHHGTLVGAH